MSDQISIDLENWLGDKIAESVRDTVLRFKMIGKPPHEACASVAATLIASASKFLAATTRLAPHQAGDMFALMFNAAKEDWAEMQRANESAPPPSA